jgi:NADH-quinone oxidoreductase subunit C
VSPVTDNDSFPRPGTEHSSAEHDRPERVPGEDGQLQPAAHQHHEPVVAGRERRGMFGVRDAGDTSGFGGLRLPAYLPPPAERPYGGWFDEFVDALLDAMRERDIPASAVEQVTVDRGEITLYVDREHLVGICQAMRDDAMLRFELCSSVSGVDYGDEVERRLHSTYQLTSMTYRRRVRLEVAVSVADPHIPSVVGVYPTADWQERETWDMFGIVYDGHPALTRILMPDDWDGHPQRKDYPLGGIPVEYKGAEIPPPDQRRAYS